MDGVKLKLRFVMFIFHLEITGCCRRDVRKWRRNLLSSITCWFREVLCCGMYVYMYDILKLTWAIFRTNSIYFKYFIGNSFCASFPLLLCFSYQNLDIGTTLKKHNILSLILLCYLVKVQKL